MTSDLETVDDSVVAAARTLVAAAAPPLLHTILGAVFDETVAETQALAHAGDIAAQTALARARAHRRHAVALLGAPEVVGDVRQIERRELHWWFAALIRLTDALIPPERLDYDALRQLLVSMRLLTVFDEVSLAEVMHLIDRSRDGRRDTWPTRERLTDAVASAIFCPSRRGHPGEDLVRDAHLAAHRLKQSFLTTVSSAVVGAQVWDATAPPATMFPMDAEGQTQLLTLLYQAYDAHVPEGG